MNIAIVGATGVVGQELLRLLDQFNISCERIRVLGSNRSVGRTISKGNTLCTVESLTIEAFQGMDVALFCTPENVSRQWVPVALEQGCRVIDGSSAFRMDPETPLVIPEINGEECHFEAPIIASPNCTATIALMALAPLHRRFEISTIIAASYQAVSGSGLGGFIELEKQVRSWSDKRKPQCQMYAHPIAFNAIPCIGNVDELGVSGEEKKFSQECKRILNALDINISITCVRLPIVRAHSLAIHVGFKKPVNINEARQVLSQSNGIKLMDDPREDIYPTPIDLSEKLYCGVGRLRQDTAFENGLAFWVSGDQLWKGAALNMVQLLERIHIREKALL